MKLTTGCYISDNEGWRGIGRVVILAERLGYPLTAEDGKVVADYLAAEETDESVFHIHDEAEAWLNANMRPDNAAWYWNDGNFGLWEDDDADEF